MSRANFSSERCHDLFEALRLLQLLIICPRRLESFLFLVILLRRHDFFRDQIAPAVRCYFGDVEIRFRLRQLLIDFRRFDLGQQLALGHIIADVHFPAFHVTIGAGINRRFLKRLKRSRQDQLLCFSIALGADHVDGDLGRLFGERVLLVSLANVTPGADDHDKNKQCRRRDRSPNRHTADRRSGRNGSLRRLRRLPIFVRRIQDTVSPFSPRSCFSNSSSSSQTNSFLRSKL